MMAAIGFGKKVALAALGISTGAGAGKFLGQALSLTHLPKS